MRESFLEFLVKARMRHEEELLRRQSAGVVRTSFSGLMLLHVRAGFPTTSVPVLTSILRVLKKKMHCFKSHLLLLAEWLSGSVLLPPIPLSPPLVHLSLSSSVHDGQSV